LIFTGIHQAKDAVIVSQKITLPSRSYYSRYFILRIPFLISYEIFFRGLLLFLNIEKFGLGMAIIIDMLLNFILHVFSGKKMQWACIPFSLVACLLNYHAQAVWPSIILHLAISISFELTSVKRFIWRLKAIS
jgi:membrane protease YdiL (CAAX protease family)